MSALTPSLSRNDSGMYQVLKARTHLNYYAIIYVPGFLVTYGILDLDLAALGKIIFHKNELLYQTISDIMNYNNLRERGKI